MSERASIFALQTGTDAKPDNGNGGDNGSELNATGGDTATTERPRFSFIDPGTVSDERSGGNGDGGTAGEPIRKRRGRKLGSTNSKSNQTISITGLTEIILNAHNMLAAFTKTAELEISDDEAAKLAAATTMVSRHYSVAMAAKTVDWTNFAMVAGMIYGTRMVAIRNRQREERKNKPAPPAKPTKDADPYAAFHNSNFQVYEPG